ncbi:MAG: MaoC/PaaZ C-terminal domain-containing protein [Streptosporangiaceae bacterium]
MHRAITQHHVNIFAAATHDHQWIHVEPERAAKGPTGAQSAHGYLTLSFCPVFLDDVLQIDAATAAVNYASTGFASRHRCQSAAGYAGT